MDTRFWGPCGWRLLHLSVTAPLNGRDFNKIKEFFELLPYVLPCKFCRQSLSKYYSNRPIPDSYDKMNKWLYLIHNDVNDKLRSQNLLNQPNPPFEKVQDDYMKWSQSPCASSTILGWDFLFSIANTTPSKSLHSSPIVEKWWNLIKEVFPFKPWKSAWEKGELTYGKAPVSNGKKAVLTWLFNIQKVICQSMMEDTPYNSFSGLCKEVSAFSSGCGKAKTKSTKTCRAKKQSVREKLRKSRNLRNSA